MAYRSTHKRWSGEWLVHGGGGGVPVVLCHNWAQEEAELYRVMRLAAHWANELLAAAYSALTWEYDPTVGDFVLIRDAQVCHRHTPRHAFGQPSSNELFEVAIGFES